MKGTNVETLADSLGIELGVFLQIIGMPSRTFRRRRHSSLTDVEADRVSRVERIKTDAERVFGNQMKARRWLTAPSAFLGHRPPALLLGTDAGTVLVSEELYRIEWGDLA